MSIFKKLHDFLIPPVGGSFGELKAYVPEKYKQAVNIASERHGINPGFLASIINTENREWDEKKKAMKPGETSLGLGQINSATRDYIRKKYKFFMRDRGGESIDASAWYLKDISRRIKSDNEEDIAIAYNRGVEGFLRGDKNDEYVKTVNSFKN